MPEIDHYSVLGVLPTADEVVVRAAYRALAQRYHPDKWRGDLKEATERMVEINAAYAVLSDPIKRREYDKTHGSGRQAELDDRDDDRDKEPNYDPLLDDWQIAVGFYPDLLDIEKSLAKFSWRVAYAYRATLLQTQRFDDRRQVAQAIERDYLERFFGKDKDVVEFARSLILIGNRQAARALNQAVRVLGSKSDANRIIDRIAQEYCPSNFETPVTRARKREEDDGLGFLGQFYLFVIAIIVIALVLAVIVEGLPR
jgi:curved DNA-binding protein CbpA